VPTHRKQIFEATLLFFLTLGLLKLLYLFRSTSWVSQNLLALSAATQLFLPLLYFNFRKFPVDFLEGDLQSFFRSVRTFLIIGIVIFPLFLFGAHFYETLFLNKEYFSSSFPKFFSTLLIQVVLIAFPEEFFFRGWLQTFLNRFFKKRWSLLGTPIGAAWLLTALIFAFSHSLITFQWWHFAIFFPALAFGWLRERTGGITAPILFHATSNLLVRWIEIHYR